VSGGGIGEREMNTMAIGFCFFGDVMLGEAIYATVGFVGT